MTKKDDVLDNMTNMPTMERCTFSDNKLIKQINLNHSGKNRCH